MAAMRLIVGNRNYSSWSLRPWMALRAAGAEFDVEMLHLDAPGIKARILAHNPAGKLPVLFHGTLSIWESLAICEYTAELFPGAGLWPDDRAARAVARAAASEMHAGFADLRRDMPMNIRADKPGHACSPGCDADIVRLLALWESCLDRFGGEGDFLFGRFSVADAMFAPVVSRFATYGVAAPGAGAAYMAAMLSHPAMAEWTAAARGEPETIARIDDI